MLQHTRSRLLNSSPSLHTAVEEASSDVEHSSADVEGASSDVEEVSSDSSGDLKPDDIDDTKLIPSGARYALKVIFLPQTSATKARELRDLHAYEISLLDQLGKCDGVVRIYDSEVRATQILLLLELAVSDLGTWLYYAPSSSGDRGEQDHVVKGGKRSRLF